MQLVSGPCKTFSCILTVDLDLWMNSLTWHIIFEVDIWSVMKFTWNVYRIWHHKIWFLTNFYQMQLISCHYKAFSLIWPLILTFICTYGFKNYWVKYWCCMYEIHVLSVFHSKQLVSNHIEWNAACIRSVQAIFLHFDCWSWPLNWLIDLRYNLWGGKYEVCFNKIYWKSVSHHKISHLT